MTGFMILFQTFCRTIQNRLILIAVIIVELLILIGVMVWKFKK